MTTMTITPATVSTTTKAVAVPKATTTTKAAAAVPKASTTTKAAAPKAVVAGELQKNAARNADRLPDLGTYTTGDKVTTADGREWTVAGPAQGGTTLKLTREQDGKKESVFRFARNITPAK